MSEMYTHQERLAETAAWNEAAALAKAAEAACWDAQELLIDEHTTLGPEENPGFYRLCDLAATVAELMEENAREIFKGDRRRIVRRFAVEA